VIPSYRGMAVTDLVGGGFELRNVGEPTSALARCRFQRILPAWSCSL